MKRICAWVVCLCIIVISFSGCTKTATEVSSLEARVTANEMLNTAPLIFLGEVTAEQDGFYCNPDGSKTVDGIPAFNMWVTPYTVKIKELYKGNLKDGISELTVSTGNFSSPQDQKEQNIEYDKSDFYLHVGDTAVFCVTYYEIYGTYTILFGDSGCFFPTETDGIYASDQNTININTITGDIKAAEQSGDTLPIEEDEIYIKKEDQKV